MNIIITIVLGLLGFLVLVASHELGHFTFAKLFGIRVPTFSIGMGPRLFGFKKNGTDYVFSLFPIGGYVHVYGMEKGEMNGEPDEFLSKSLLKQYLVIFGGPLFSFLFGFLLFYGSILSTGVSVIQNAPISVSVTNVDSVPFLNNDSIISVNGKKVVYWDDVYKYAKENENNTFQVFRNGNVVNITLPKTKFSMLGNISPVIPAVVGQVEKNSAAFKSGLKRGDKVLAVDSTDIRDWNNFVSIIKTKAGQKVGLKILRGNDTLHLFVVPKEQKGLDHDTIVTYGAIGVMVKTPKIGVNPIYAISLAYDQSISSIKLIGYQLKLLIEKKVSPKMLGGPVSIVKLTGDYANWGMAALIGFIAFISINLALINILPFPPLDGGQMVLFTFYRIFGEKMSEKIMMVIEYTGFALIILLMLYVTYNDIIRLFHK
ncbi:MAG TPA: RIP metalloprotease RseP [Firmicutes bacterium]|uniref:Zinc metalloprotease n=1 Tax=candidate division TA06 bacterium TaxID=2250710 RepID=A0A660SDH2_UNCT6|nr:MAG: RIP metalloprotease RseP [candidate division TA06 bacterium]HFD04949.1 RIP metalloprotease RseP [Bacillota bacterium]